MIASLKPYPVYKFSGVEWLGDVPVHWLVRRLKSLCSRSALYGANVAATSYETTGVRFIRTTDITEGGHLKDSGVYLPEELIREYLLEDGDLLISRSGTVGRSFLYRHKIHGLCAYAGYLVRFVPLDKVLPRYIFFFTKAQSFAWFIRVKAISSTIENVNAEKYANCSLPLPPLVEQTAIARYLDYVDRRIQRYIRAKQKLIALLKEQKQAIIHQAVTGQIDVRTGQPYPAYKPSGVESLGDVPAHWEMRRLKTLCTMKSGDSITATTIEPTGKFPVYGGNGLRGYTSSFTHDGDFTLIGRQGALCGNVHIAHGKFWASEHAIVATLRSRYILEWFCASLSVMNLNQYSISAAQPGLSVERILNLWLAIPRLGEQAVIATSVNQQISSIDTSISRARRKIELLNEYRASLIADVVTGKLDVREAASTLPEVDPLILEDTLNDTLDTGFESDIDELDVILEDVEA